MKIRFAKPERKLLIFAALSVLGAVLLFGSWWLDSYSSPQYAAYNQGVQLYQKAMETGEPADAEKAIKAFDGSLNAYSQERGNLNWLEQHLLPEPSRELAAQAQFHKGVMYLLLQKPEMTVNSFKESLKLNPGDEYGNGLSSSEAKRLKEQAYVVKYDLELLFKKNPSMAQKEGKGQGKPGQGKGDKPSPGNDPGKLPGKGKRDDI